ncbi:hypothetical protein PPACK8108_LOCUS17472 [Phakopsora pachyrhizi]|uniref:Uncharacterized protein n=1 Tax=Phakopsora pachyrhizi TaxID=170000 RepID=A0AAV0B990_PHAPC|nr:hypothetical protein PPACK8108_LOCUS17472 [Phakopsora pachyrhizi]
MTCLSDVEEHVAPVDRERNKEDDPRSGGGPGGHRVCGEQLVMVGIKYGMECFDDWSLRYNARGHDPVKGVFENRQREQF